jgi:choline dehydrogenase-like flavoprotein
MLDGLLRDMSEGWFVLATIAEDLPYANNRIQAAQGRYERIELDYTLHPEAHRRIARLREHMAQALRGRKWRRLAQVGNNQRLAHICGTCRFGDDPRTSVLDRDNRVHDVDNLFVVDGSFFPSSGGTNPSLTIAANAMRVGQGLVQDWL